jgi:hypothetical protein
MRSCLPQAAQHHSRQLCQSICVAKPREEFATGDRVSHTPSGFLLRDTLSHTGVKS